MLEFVVKISYPTHAKETGKAMTATYLEQVHFDTQNWADQLTLKLADLRAKGKISDYSVKLHRERVVISPDEALSRIERYVDETNKRGF